jgi:hypothetical protein
MQRAKGEAIFLLTFTHKHDGVERIRCYVRMAYLTLMERQSSEANKLSKNNTQTHFTNAIQRPQ